MNPRSKPPWTDEDLARWRSRGIEALTIEELAQLQQKLEEWIRQRGPQAGTPRRRRPFIIKPRASARG